MKRKWKVILTLIGAALLGGCVTPVPNMKLSEIVTASVAPEADMALVYFLHRIKGTEEF